MRQRQHPTLESATCRATLTVATDPRVGRRTAKRSPPATADSGVGRYALRAAPQGQSHHCWAFVAVLVALCVSAESARSQTAGPPEASPALRAVLARVEFNGGEKPDELGKALAELEAGDLAVLCDMLVEPGTGDDTKARMALQGLTWYVGSTGTAAERSKYVEALRTALEADKPAAVKAFVIRQLQWVGDERAVPVLAGFIQDDELYDFAVQALLAIGGDDVVRSFRRAHQNVDGRQRVAVIDAVGSLGDSESTDLLVNDVTSEDRGTRLAAFAALADSAPVKLLDEASESLDAGSWYERARVDALWLRAAERLGRAGDKHEAEKALARCEAHASADALPHVQCALLSTSATIWGPGAVGGIVKGITGDDPEVRACATDLAATLSGAGVTEALVTALDEAEPAGRAQLVRVLERRGDRAALPAVLRALDDEDLDVRLAAVAAVPTLAPDAAAEQLVTFLHTHLENEERAAARQALVQLPGEQVNQYLGTQVESSPPHVRATLLEVLADRRARDQLPCIFRAARHEDPDVRLAAIRAVQRLGDEHAAPELLSLLAGVGSERDRAALEAALAATCSRAAVPAERAAPILAALNADDDLHYASLLRVLGHVGGAEALDAVRGALQDERAAVRDTAFRALLEWPDPDAAPDVLDIARKTDELKYHVLALRAFARLAALDGGRSPETLLEMYAEGLRVARRPEERKLLLSKIGEVPDARALRMLERYLEDEQLAAEAAAAMITVADKLLPRGWQEARAAAEAVLATAQAESVRQRADKVLGRVSQYEDFITDWRVAGPFTREQTSGNQLFDIAFPPEQAGAEVEWHRPPVVNDPESYWRVDLQADPAIRGDHRAAYLSTRVFSPQAQDARLEVGSDDGIKIWLNGEVVRAANVLRGCARGADIVAVKLRAGWNDLLVKVTNNGGGWAACVRVRDPDGGRLEGLRAEAGSQR